MNKNSIHQALREQQKSQSAQLIWITGLSASGKSTLANALEERLYKRGHHTYLLDGDKVRAGLNQDLNFCKESREENIRRLGEVSRLLVDAGLIVICAAISPFQDSREKVRALFDYNVFIEIYLSTPLDVCEYRDPKNLYQQARAGKISDFTGIASPYETPLNPEITINTSAHTVSQCVEMVMDYLLRKKHIR